MTKPTVEALLHEAMTAFWEVIVKHYPEAETGDLSPLTTFHFGDAAKTAVKEWIWANVPNSGEPEE